MNVDVCVFVCVCVCVCVCLRERERFQGREMIPRKFSNHRHLVIFRLNYIINDAAAAMAKSNNLRDSISNFATIEN